MPMGSPIPPPPRNEVAPGLLIPPPVGEVKGPRVEGLEEGRKRLLWAAVNPQMVGPLLPLTQEKDRVPKEVGAEQLRRHREVKIHPARLVALPLHEPVTEAPCLPRLR